MLTIHEMPISERPRERLKNSGAIALSDAELLAIILGSGSRGKSVLGLAQELLPIVDTNWERFDLTDLNGIKGIGAAKGSQIVAALEFARRRIRPHGVKIAESKDAVPLLRHLADRMQEHFVCISLNGAHEVIATRVITIGLVNSTQIHPREVFSDPLCDRACAIIVAHNHPSGNTTPSEEDKKVTRILSEAGSILGIKLLDHIIFTPRSHFSFAEAGLISHRIS